MLPTLRPVSKIRLSGTSTATMPPTTLAPLTFDKPSDLRIVLVPTPEDAATNITISDNLRSELDDDESLLSEMHPPADQNIPVHPVPSMQEAFAESLHEVTNGQDGPGKPKLRELDAKGRREKLIEQAAQDEPFDTTWRYRPGQEQHEVYKLISQITFGVYLLLNGLAADDSQVVSILQGHINEVDEFLEVMLEDFAQAHQDLTERIAHLQLPMGNRNAFEGMLEDRNFRAQILAGNEKIDHILARTNAAMKQWDDDIDAGLRSSEAFMDWLNEHKDAEWAEASPDLGKISRAMKGNADGWLNAFDDLNNQAQDLNGLIIKLMTIVAEMEKTAGEVSRKTWATIPPFTLPIHASQTDDPESPSSPTSSRARSATPVGSVGSRDSASTLHAPKRIADPEVDTLSDFPLPGSTPLLPPRMSFQLAAPQPTVMTTLSPTVYDGPTLSPTVYDGQPTLSPTVYDGKPKLTPSEPKRDVPKHEEPETEASPFDDALFILQPRTYTPRLPEPLPSPMVKNSPPQLQIQTQTQQQMRPQSRDPHMMPPPRDSQMRPQSRDPQMRPQSRDPHMMPQSRDSQMRPQSRSQTKPPPRPSSRSQSQAQSPQMTQGQGFLQKKTSLRQRVSQKTTPPESIHIPPRNAAEAMSVRPSTSTSMQQPRMSQVPDSTYASDLEVCQPHRLPRASSHADFSAPSRPQLMPTPHSEHQQFYHPVRASPHSPLQQRPHTADPRDGYFPGHVRQQPSRVGGMSTLSSVTSATYDDTATLASRATTQAGGKRLKKKKSALGWLKKAFSMDEDERAEYQARKAMQYNNQFANQQYFETSPKFLDGKRLR
ncbi:hypothetical protein BGZ61DRAFT_527860 [Ilyonectria robusta]|uniref:uncharacterized protein n=1 Tax=Ilyonectria robusta TaxID=1079257 RepID=UPI001E8D46FA|nr:uncharacterized protein BGZ61DRAFT_527860 [Ilyonectria robusta]KAH8734532.1 hypothetical protein BGZ61DRAFT_527860 [Ilyonectria robusta]